MAQIQLVPEGGGEIIDVSEHSIVIGRGPFLKVMDKRVSRNHALLEILYGKLHLTPTHSNPCFLRMGRKGNQLVLKRDVRQQLEDGDMFGLLPTQLFFTVVYTGRSSEGSRRAVKKPHDAVAPAEKRAAARQINMETDNDRNTGRCKPVKQGVVRVRDVRDRPLALPLTTKRKLPSWMLRLAAFQAPVPKSKPSPAKPWSAPTCPGTGRGRSRGSKQHVDYDEDEENKDYNRGKAAKAARGATGQASGHGGMKGGSKHLDDEGQAARGSLSRRAATRNKPSYVDAGMLGEDADDSEEAGIKGDSDDDFHPNAKHDAESDSDTGLRPWSQAKKGHGSPLKRQRGAGVGKVRPASSSPGEEGFDESDDEYIPRPTKKRKGGVGKQKCQSTDSEEADEEKEVKIKVKKPTSKGPNKKGKTPCYYGAKCYRKNPDHFKQFSHPDDSETEEKSTRPGRKGTAKKQVKTEVNKDQSKAGRKRKAEKEEEDEDLPNTYDYNDSFIDDVSQSLSQSQEQRSDGDSDDDAEDIDSLMKEAKSFVRNKKLLKR